MQRGFAAKEGDLADGVPQAPSDHVGKVPSAPFILWTRSRPSGERVYLWCRAGTSAADFSSARKLLAAACMAKDIKVSQHARYAHLIALDVIRREPPAEWNGHPLAGWFRDVVATVQVSPCW